MTTQLQMIHLRWRDITLIWPWEFEEIVTRKRELITSDIQVDGSDVDGIMLYKLFTIGTYIFTHDINKLFPCTCQKLLLIGFTYKIFMFHITISRWNSAQFKAILFVCFLGVSNYLNWTAEPFSLQGSIFFFLIFFSYFCRPNLLHIKTYVYVDEY